MELLVNPVDAMGEFVGRQAESRECCYEYAAMTDHRVGLRHQWAGGVMQDGVAEETIIVTELDDRVRRLVRDAGKGKLRLVVAEADGRAIAEIRRIDRDGSLWADYDPDVARAAWQRGAGSLHGIDIDSLLAEIKAERELI